MLEPSETIICLDDVAPANQSLLSYYVPYASRVVPNKEMLGDLAEYAELLEESTAIVRLADDKARFYHSLFHEVDAAWQQQARPPLVSLRAAHRVKGRRWLSSLGLPDDGWFAAFHCRTTIGHQDVRSVRTETYILAMEAVVCVMMERLAGVVSDIAPWEEAAQQRLREFRQNAAIGHGPIMAGKTRMGREFLRRNAAVLGLGSPQAS